MSRARTLAGAIGSDGALNVADVAGLAAVASSGSASDLSTGTLPNARLASGAAVANLGYTPVNKAGDSMTGSLSTTQYMQANQYMVSKHFVEDGTEIDLSALSSSNYYPVVITGGGDRELNFFEITRSYGDTYPALGLGALRARFMFSGYSWGGNYVGLFMDTYMTGYRNLLGTCGTVGYYLPCVMLRGGYKYWIKGNHVYSPSIVTSYVKWRNYGDGYDYYLGPISASTMAARGDYMGETNYIGSWTSKGSNLQGIGA